MQIILLDEGRRVCSAICYAFYKLSNYQEDCSAFFIKLKKNDATLLSFFQNSQVMIAKKFDLLFAMHFTQRSRLLYLFRQALLFFIKYLKVKRNGGRPSLKVIKNASFSYLFWNNMINIGEYIDIAPSISIILFDFSNKR